MSPAAGHKGRDDLDAAGGLVTPSLVDAHVHPDKALTFPRVGPLPTTSLQQSLLTGASIKAGFTREDVRERASRAIEVAVTNGVGAMRAQVDVDTAIGLTAFEALLEVKEAYADILDMQLVAFPQEGIVRDPGVLALLREALSSGAQALGGGPDNEGDRSLYGEHLDQLFKLAQEYDVPLDVHADMTEVPEQRALELVARKTIDYGREGRVNAVHCCALASYPQDYADQVIDLLAEAQVQICICPVGNLQLVGEGDPPMGRGASRPKGLLAGGVNVAIGSDNLYDMWFRFGDLDPVHNCLVTCLSGAMRTDAEVLEAFSMVTSRAARYLGLTDYGIEVGNRADLVVFSASSLDDVLRGVPGSRTTLKAGRVVSSRTTSTALTGRREEMMQSEGDRVTG